MKNEEKELKGVTTMKGKYLNPKADLTFKLIFGEYNKYLVVVFRNLFK